MAYFTFATFLDTIFFLSEIFHADTMQTYNPLGTYVFVLLPQRKEWGIPPVPLLVFNIGDISRILCDFTRSKKVEVLPLLYRAQDLHAVVFSLFSLHEVYSCY